MNFKNIILASAEAAAVLSAAASCAQNDIDKSGLADKDVPSFTLTVTCTKSDADETKTGINGLAPYWQAGDGIWLSDGTNSTRAVIPAQFDGCTSATLKVSGIDSTGTIYALYPYDANAEIKSGRIMMTIGAVQDGLFSGAHHMVGKKDPGQAAMKLVNACPVIKFTTSREDLYTMQMHNPSTCICGRYKVDPTTGAKALGDKSFYRFRMDFKNNPIGDHYVSIFAMAIPAGTGFTFITKEGRMGTLKTSVKNTLKNGYLYNLGQIDDKIAFDTEPAKDLSANESANCYIANGPGSYRFKAVKGNSSTSVGNVAFGDVLWETSNTTTAPAQFSLISEIAFSNGYIYFRIPDGAGDGNALVAARDTDGNILWSWHIWILKDGVTNQKYTGYSEAMMMDRNLGALSAEAGNPLSLGFLYQWGRKDPFTGSASESTPSSAAIAGTALNIVERTPENGNVEYATAHPTTYIYKGSSSWMENDDLSVWNAKDKTIYDPCPPGYHIPSSKAFDGLTKSNTKWNATTHGRSITLGGKAVWFPAGGFRSSTSGYINSTGSSIYLYTDEATSELGGNYVNATSSTFKISTSPGAHSSGFSVRCQKLTDSGIEQNVRMQYNVEDPDLKVYAPYIVDKVFTPIHIVWGSGDPEEYGPKQYIYHRFDRAGTYSIILDCMDVNEIWLDPMGDLDIFDLSTF